MQFTYLAIWYLAFSTLTLIAYAIDKSAAIEKRQRTPEKTLHVLSLIGGWPGALLAQRYLRHKSKKTAFQFIFWLTVFFNCAALGWLILGEHADLVRTFSGVSTSSF